MEQGKRVTHFHSLQILEMAMVLSEIQYGEECKLIHF